MKNNEAIYVFFNKENIFIKAVTNFDQAKQFANTYVPKFVQVYDEDGEQIDKGTVEDIFNPKYKERNLIPFNYELRNTHAIVTRSGKLARVLDVIKDAHPMVVAIMQDEQEFISQYPMNGIYSDGIASGSDLFMVKSEIDDVSHRF